MAPRNPKVRAPVAPPDEDPEEQEEVEEEDPVPEAPRVRTPVAVPIELGAASVAVRTFGCPILDALMAQGARSWEPDSDRRPTYVTIDAFVDGVRMKLFERGRIDDLAAIDHAYLEAVYGGTDVGQRYDLRFHNRHGIWWNYTDTVHGDGLKWDCGEIVARNAALVRGKGKAPTREDTDVTDTATEALRTENERMRAEMEALRRERDARDRAPPAPALTADALVDVVEKVLDRRLREMAPRESAGQTLAQAITAAAGSLTPLVVSITKDRALAAGRIEEARINAEKDLRVAQAQAQATVDAARLAAEGAARAAVAAEQANERAAQARVEEAKATQAKVDADERRRLDKDRRDEADAARTRQDAFMETARVQYQERVKEMFDRSQAVQVQNATRQLGSGITPEEAQKWMGIGGTLAALQKGGAESPSAWGKIAEALTPVFTLFGTAAVNIMQGAAAANGAPPQRPPPPQPPQEQATQDAWVDPRWEEAHVRDARTSAPAPAATSAPEAETTSAPAPAETTAPSPQPTPVVDGVAPSPTT